MRLNRVDLMLAGVVAGPITAVPISGRAPILWFVDAAICVLAVFLVFRAGSHKLEFTGAEPWMVLYLLIAGLTVLMAPDVLGFAALYKLRVMPLLALLIAYNAIQTQEDLRHMQAGLALCAAGVAVLMLINTYLYSWGYAQFDVGVDMKNLARTSIGKNNYLASIYVLLIPFCFSLFSIRKRLLGLATSLIVIVAIIATQSRGGVICLVVGVIVWMFMVASSAQKVKSLLYIATLIVVAIVGLYSVQRFLPVEVLEDFSHRFERLWKKAQEDPESADTRVSLARDGIAAFASSPLLGVGLGRQVEFAAARGRVLVHNLYIELLMQTGIFSFLAYMMFLLVCGWNLFRLRKSFKVGPERVLVASMCAAFLTTLLNAAVEPSYWAPQFSCLFAIVLGMGFAQRRLVRRAAPAARPAPVAFRPAFPHAR